MKSLLTLFALAGSTAGLLGEPKSLVYVPAKSDELWTVAVTESTDGTARLEVVDQLKLDLPPGAIASHPTKPLLYVATGYGPNSSVTTFRIGQDGKPEQIGRIADEKGNCYLRTDHAGKHLFSVSHNQPVVTVFRLDEEGLPTEASSRFDTERVRAHSIALSPDDRFAYVPHVKDDNRLRQLRFDAEQGTLVPLDPTDAEVADGIGPRHVARHPTEPILYFSNEQQLGVSAYRINEETGELSLLAVVPADLEAADRITASDIVLSPDGSQLFSMIREIGNEHLDRVVAWDIGADGVPKLRGSVPADNIPWSMDLTADGKYLLVVAHSGALLLYRLPEDDGLPEQVARLEVPQKTNTLLVQP